jgi:hypothetical protein
MLYSRGKKMEWEIEFRIVASNNFELGATLREGGAALERGKIPKRPLFASGLFRMP